jgi:hypothetical protein
MTNHDPSWPWLGFEVEEKINDALAAGLEHPDAPLPADLWPDSSGSWPRSKIEYPSEPGGFEPDAETSAETPAGAVHGAGSQSEDDSEPLLPGLERATAFPLDALGTVVRDAAKAFVQLTQAPEAIAGQTILAGLNVVAQRHVDVLVPQGGDNPRVGSVQPVSSFFLTVATTGERKSSCEKIALKVHRAYERVAQRKYREELDAFRQRKTVWEAEKKRILNPRKDKSSSNFLEQLKQLGPEPEPPPDPTFLFDNPTWQGLVKKLRHNVRDVGLFSDDAGKMLGGFSMGAEQRQATAANMNSAWDGKPMQRILAGEEAFILEGVRLSQHLMAQPKIAAKLLGDDVLADQGFLARFLVSAPDLRELPRSWSVAERWTEACIAEYESSIRVMLETPVKLNEFGKVERRALYLSREAFDIHKSLYDQIQAQLVPYGSLILIKGLAEKAPEHACRLAATLAFADDPKITEIRVDHYQAAVALMRHYVSEALRLKHRRELDNLRRRADELWHWLRQLHAAGTTRVDARTIQQSAPRGTGCRTSVDEVLKVVALLQQRGWLRPVALDRKSTRIKGRSTWDIHVPP